MIFPTCVVKTEDGKPLVLNLSQVECLVDHGDWVSVTFTSGKIRSFHGEDAVNVRGSLLYIHKTYVESAEAFNKAKQQAASQIVPATGKVIL